MNKCDVCGKDQVFPFHCSYCSGTFCSEHRIPESHNCPNNPFVPPPYFSVPNLPEPPTTTPPSTPVQPKDTRPRKIGRCPRCHRDNSQMIKYNAEKMIFKCHKCGLRYGQRKPFPYRYFPLRKRTNPSQPFPHTNTIYETRKNKHGKAVAATLFLMVALLLVIWYVASPFSAFSPSNSTTTQSPTVFPSPTPYSLQSVFPSATILPSPSHTQVAVSTTPTPTPPSRKT